MYLNFTPFYISPHSLPNPLWVYKLPPNKHCATLQWLRLEREEQRGGREITHTPPKGKPEWTGFGIIDITLAQNPEHSKLRLNQHNFVNCFCDEAYKIMEFLAPITNPCVQTKQSRLQYRVEDASLEKTWAELKLEKSDLEFTAVIESTFLLSRWSLSYRWNEYSSLITW